MTALRCCSSSPFQFIVDEDEESEMGGGFDIGGGDFGDL